MPTFSAALQKDEIHLKDSFGPKASGHVVDFGTYTSENGSYRPWITKFNKHAGKRGVDASILEVGFSEVASLFIKPGLTPPAKVVIDGDEVIGVASENFNVQVKKTIDEGHPCYALDPASWIYSPISMEIDQEKIQPERESLSAISPSASLTGSLDDSQAQVSYGSDDDEAILSVSETEPDTPPDVDSDSEEREILSAPSAREPKDTLTTSSVLEPEEMSDDTLTQRLQLKNAQKGVHFLDKMPRGFFQTLIAKHNSGEVIVDMGSLASILTASYVLEEDDLHKGNIGFYVTSEPGSEKKKIVFFKIDHDLMFGDSIMSQRDMRLANILYNKDSFKITARDLDGFPDLRDSGNHYWPTKDPLMATGPKAYTDHGERAAFAGLKNDPEFTKAKWGSFLKHCVIPLELVRKSLTMHLDPKTDADKIDMITNALWARTAALKAALLASPSFLKYMNSADSEQALETIKEEIRGYLSTSGVSGTEQEKIIEQVKDSFVTFRESASATAVSPLIKTILLNAYTFPSKVSAKNKPKEQEITWAIGQFKGAVATNPKEAYRLACIIPHLAATSSNKNSISPKIQGEMQQFKKEYLHPQPIKTLAQFQAAAEKITQSDLPLKQQKKELLAVLKASSMTPKDLQQLKGQLKQREPELEWLKFVKQLRSDSWLVRKFHGAYGSTRTASAMTSEINSQIKRAHENHFFHEEPRGKPKESPHPRPISKGTL